MVVLGTFPLNGGLGRCTPPDSRLGLLPASGMLGLPTRGRRLRNRIGSKPWVLVVSHVAASEPALDLLAVQYQLCVHGLVHISVLPDVLGVHPGSRLKLELDGC